MIKDITLKNFASLKGYRCKFERNYMKKYSYTLMEWNKGEHNVAGTTTNPARTVVSTWRSGIQILI